MFVRIAIDSEPVLGTLGVSWGDTLNGTLVQHRAPCTHIQPYRAVYHIGMFLDGGRYCNWRFKKKHVKLLTDCNPSSGLNQGQSGVIILSVLSSC